MGLQSGVTAVVDGNGGGHQVSAAVAVRVSGAVKGAAEEIDGVALEAEAYVGIDGGGDADVGVAEEFLDRDEFDALFQEQGCGGVPEVVEGGLVPNERLRAVMAAGGWTYAALAHEVEIDPKSVERWVNQALDIVRPIDTGSWQRRQGTMESAVDTAGRDTGFTATSGGEYRSFRLDADGKIGPHINVMTGKGAAVRKWAIRFPGGGISTWLRRNV